MRMKSTLLPTAFACSVSAPVIDAFLMPLPDTAAGGVPSIGPHCRPRLRTQLQPLDAVPVQPDQDLPLPPRDETFNPLAAVRELLAAPDVVEGSRRYDRLGSKTGGIWRSIIVGLVPCTVLTAQQGTEWLSREESAGNVYQDWPDSFCRVLGEKAFINLSLQPELHAIGRRPFSEALSPKAVLGRTLIVEKYAEESMLRLERLARDAQEVVMLDELKIFVREAFVGVLFGDYATQEFKEDVERYLPAMSRGVFSVPVRLPWPLNKFPAFSFGKAMDARKEFQGTVRTLLSERRADLAVVGSTETGAKSAGILDSLVDIQQQQQQQQQHQQIGSETHGDSFSFDDDFIIDNVITSLFAADTTSVVISRVLQLLGTTDEGEKLVNQLVQELGNVATSNESSLDNTGSDGGGASRAGILKNFPLLDAVILESVRLHPPIPAVFRKTRKKLSYNGYSIPEGKLINWNLIQGLRSESLYPEPKRFCPFRFMHGDKNQNTSTPGQSSSPGGVSAQQPQPPPAMFGFGRHICPGRELSKLEILLYLKTFLNKFDYKLVEGQSFKGVLPINGPKDKLRVILKAKAKP